MSADPAVVERFIELRAQGLTYDLIAQELNCSKRILLFWNKAFKGRIATLRATHLENLLDKYAVMKENRIELFGKRLQNLVRILDRRELEDMSSAKILGLILRYASALKREEADLEHALGNPDEEALKSIAR